MSTDDRRPCGSLEVLKGEFTSVFADGEDGIFAIGIDRTDPDFDEGCAVLFGGDDGNFFPSTMKFDADKLACLASVLTDANPAAERICVRQGRCNLVLRSHSAQEVSKTIPLNVDLRMHRGFLAAGEHFCALVSPYGDNLDHVALHLMMADTQAEVWREVKVCHVHWLPELAKVACDAVSPDVPEPEQASAPAMP
jgi:hypothetical protein